MTEKSKKPVEIDEEDEDFEKNEEETEDFE